MTDLEYDSLVSLVATYGESAVLSHVKDITARIQTEALEKIRDYPANGNSDPDVMAEAIGAMQTYARLALQSTKND